MLLCKKELLISEKTGAKIIPIFAPAEKCFVSIYYIIIYLITGKVHFDE